MRRLASTVATVVVMAALGAASGCSPQQPAQATDPSSGPAPNLMRMAALCHEHGGEWVQQTGCRMTEKLCTTAYHGSWQAPSCAIPPSEIKATECNQAGGQPSSSGDACLIYFLNLDASQYMK